ncbi:MAG: ROK family protein [Haemophilus parainfluenzae]
MFGIRYWWHKNRFCYCENGEIQQRKQISTPQDDAAQAMHQTLAQLLKEYEGQFDYVAVASTGIINQGILTALNPKTWVD